MTKQEFLTELEVSLSFSMPAEDIGEILADYNDIFENGIIEGKSEEQLSKELGSPAKIAHTILSEEKKSRPQPEVQYAHMKKEPAPPSNLASMGIRLCAYAIDSILFGAVFVFVFIVSNVTYSTGGAVETSAMETHGGSSLTGMLGAFSSIVFMLLFFAVTMLGSTLLVWLTNGYTPGKWFLSIRVVKASGAKITFLEAFLREAVIKNFLNALTSCLLNIGSFVWGCCTPAHKTVHDAAVDTEVIRVRKEFKGA